MKEKRKLGVVKSFRPYRDDLTVLQTISKDHGRDIKRALHMYVTQKGYLQNVLLEDIQRCNDLVSYMEIMREKKPQTEQMSYEIQEMYEEFRHNLLKMHEQLTDRDNVI